MVRHNAHSMHLTLARANLGVVSVLRNAGQLTVVELAAVRVGIRLHLHGFHEHALLVALAARRPGLTGSLAMAKAGVLGSRWARGNGLNIFNAIILGAV